MFIENSEQYIRMTWKIIINFLGDIVCILTVLWLLLFLRRGRPAFFTLLTVGISTFVRNFSTKEQMSTPATITKCKKNFLVKEKKKKILLVLSLKFCAFFFVFLNKITLREV